MSNKVIKVQLTEQSIDNAIKELEDYKTVSYTHLRAHET